MRCQSRTTKGARCRRPATTGSRYCRGHQNAPVRSDVGKPTPLADTETRDRIVTAIRAGNYIETAAAYAGVHKVSLHRYLQQGRRDLHDGAPDTPEAVFVGQVEQALAEAEVRDVTTIGQAAARGDWRASAWRLERKHGDRWGRQDRLDVTTGQPPEDLDADAILDPDSRELARELIRRAAVRPALPSGSGDTGDS